MLIVTSVPLFAASAYAAEEDRFLFAYFTGNGNVASSGGVDDQAIRFAVSSDGKAVQWVITEYATNEDMENGAEPLSSRVVTKYPDECVELVARGAVDIQYIVDGGVRTSKYIYRVYNPYGNAVEIIYSDNLISASDLDGKINYNPVLLFYKFVNWSVTDIGNDEFKVVPEFTI